ncbi:MAG: type II toxin-antitoxin system VapC family toxin [Xanthobacteraceae bacterium]
MLIYLDANLFVEALEGMNALSEACWRLLESGDQGRNSLFTSELSLAEVLVKPLERDEATLAQRYLDLIQSRAGFLVAPVDRSILVFAAHIRKDALARDRSVKLPDAIHLATAAQNCCEVIVSGDKRLEPAQPCRRIPLALDEIEALL